MPSPGSHQGRNHDPENPRIRQPSGVITRPPPCLKAMTPGPDSTPHAAKDSESDSAFHLSGHLLIWGLWGGKEEK